MEVDAAHELVLEDDEHDSKESFLHRCFLQEWDVLKALLDRIVANGGASKPHDVHRIRSIMDKYQEQGQLLEPYLESIISPLMFIIRSKIIQTGGGSDGILDIVKPLSIIIYSVITVCGYKSVIKFFPHQVSDLELAVSLLEKCHLSTSVTSLRQESTGEMELKCVVLLWLYILVLIPFDISSVDTSITQNKDLTEVGHSPLVMKILRFSKDYLSDAGPMRRIAGLLLSRLLTRPDVTKNFSSFFEWTHEVLLFEKNGTIDYFRLLGVMEALSAIFKVGSRTILADVVLPTWNDVLVVKNSTCTARSPLLRKFIMKLSQRVGLACLPCRSPSWQYVEVLPWNDTSFPHVYGYIVWMGSRLYQAGGLRLSCLYLVHCFVIWRLFLCVMVKHSSLEENFSYGASSSLCVDEHDGSGPETEEIDIDVPEIIEEIIELLLSGLRDSDTVVRWSAAKGIGRITARLTSSLSEDVLSSVLDLFSPGEGDGSWHGGCLALAELARRGLLVTACLPKVVPVIVKALHYDVRRGPHSVGSHVRDAAAYVCWAFGRAYSHSDMKAVLEHISPHLLTVACYDREVNCRRAAAAAFQENVGRQGSYPHGIEIVNIADYFSLASRSNSYLHVAVYIAQYKEYLYPFVEDLTSHKISHWDKSIRELAAVALSILAKYDNEYFAGYVLEKILPCTLSSDLCLRHGATLAAGELVSSLYRSGFSFSKEKQKSLAAVVPAIEKARLYRGKGGEIMRASVSRFIECISLAKIAVIDKTKRSLLDTLNENLKHPNAHIQGAAVDALKHFFPAYCVGLGDGVAKEVFSKYIELLTDSNPAARRGAALAIGILPSEYLVLRWLNLLAKLCNSCLLQGNPDDWDAEARVNAVRALVSVCETLTDPRKPSFNDDEEELQLHEMIKNDVMQTLFKALDDYAVDNRGDVGSWVREAAIIGLEKCAYILCRKDSSMLTKPPVAGFASVIQNEPEQRSQCQFFDANIATNLVGGIAKQAVEKLDKVRETAAKSLRRILYDGRCSVTSIPHVDLLKEIIPNDPAMKWGVPTSSYPQLVKLLQCDCYGKQVLSGLVVSVGGLQDSLRKASAAALLEYIQGSEAGIQQMGNAKEHNLSIDLLWVLERHHKLDRVVVPALKTIEILFSKKVFLNMEDQTKDFCSGLLDSLRIELKATKDFSKLFTGLSLLGYIASLSEPLNVAAFSMLLLYLGHRYPKIRKAAADQVYLVILQNGNLVANGVAESTLEMLTETCWEGNIDEAKHQRSKLLEMAGLEVVASIPEAKKMDSERKAMVDENVSYSSLVGFSGF